MKCTVWVEHLKMKTNNIPFSYCNNNIDIQAHKLQPDNKISGITYLIKLIKMCIEFTKCHNPIKFYLKSFT